ncbi:hypothetical protein EDD22DRAFT_787676, partial [Suillus occidentalis]
GRASGAPQKHNKLSDNESSALLAFPDANWGEPTRSYVISITHTGDLVIRRCGRELRTLAQRGMVHERWMRNQKMSACSSASCQ